MFDFLTLPEFQPFVTAGLVLIGLCIVEVVSLMLGHSVSGMVDHALDFDHPDIHIGHGSVLDLHSDAEVPHGNPLSSFYDWLNAGRVPLLILLMAALGAFSAVGLVLQIVAMHAAPAPLPTLIAALIAFLAVIPTTRSVSRLLARFLPRDESYAVDEPALIGRTGVVTLGPVEFDSAGRAKIEDAHGNAHFPRVKAAREGVVIPLGTKVLVVDRVGGALTVVAAEERLLEKSI
jgi:membrane protein implicated in regulation of membrane protease activity